MNGSRECHGQRTRLIQRFHVIRHLLEVLAGFLELSSRLVRQRPHYHARMVLVATIELAEGPLVPGQQNRREILRVDRWTLVDNQVTESVKFERKKKIGGN